MQNVHILFGDQFQLSVRLAFLSCYLGKRNDFNMEFWLTMSNSKALQNEMSILKKNKFPCFRCVKILKKSDFEKKKNFSYIL